MREFLATGARVTPQQLAAARERPKVFTAAFPAGRRLSESTLCRIAHAYEQATDWHIRHPNVKSR
jgi:hypothetical protein